MAAPPSFTYPSDLRRLPCLMFTLFRSEGGKTRLIPSKEPSAEWGGGWLQAPRRASSPSTLVRALPGTGSVLVDRRGPPFRRALRQHACLCKYHRPRLPAADWRRTRPPAGPSLPGRRAQTASRARQGLPTTVLTGLLPPGPLSAAAATAGGGRQGFPLHEAPRLGPPGSLLPEASPTRDPPADGRVHPARAAPRPPHTQEHPPPAHTAAKGSPATSAFQVTQPLERQTDIRPTSASGGRAGAGAGAAGIARSRARLAAFSQ